MPCLMEEVEGAEAEGVAVEVLVAPVRLERGGDRRGLRLVCRRMELGEPRTRRGGGARCRSPARTSRSSADAVIAAVGQSVEREHAKTEGLALTDRGLAADPRTLATTLPGVFAGATRSWAPTSPCAPWRRGGSPRCRSTSTCPAGPSPARRTSSRSRSARSTTTSGPRCSARSRRRNVSRRPPSSRSAASRGSTRSTGGSTTSRPGARRCAA